MFVICRPRFAGSDVPKFVPTYAFYIFKNKLSLRSVTLRPCEGSPLASQREILRVAQNETLILKLITVLNSYDKTCQLPSTDSRNRISEGLLAKNVELDNCL